MTMKPITDKAEVSLEFPEKAYMGSFGRASAFEVGVEDDGVVVKLVRSGEEGRRVAFHLHYYLLGDILEEMAAALAARPPIDEAHRVPLADAAEKLSTALRRQSA